MRRRSLGGPRSCCLHLQLAPVDAFVALVACLLLSGQTCLLVGASASGLRDDTALFGGSAAASSRSRSLLSSTTTSPPGSRRGQHQAQTNTGRRGEEPETEVHVPAMPSDFAMSRSVKKKLVVCAGCVAASVASLIGYTGGQQVGTAPDLRARSIAGAPPAPRRMFPSTWGDAPARGGPGASLLQILPGQVRRHLTKAIGGRGKRLPRQPARGGDGGNENGSRNTMEDGNAAGPGDGGLGLQDLVRRAGTNFFQAGGLPLSGRTGCSLRGSQCNEAAGAAAPLPGDISLLETGSGTAEKEKTAL